MERANRVSQKSRAVTLIVLVKLARMAKLTKRVDLEEPIIQAMILLMRARVIIKVTRPQLIKAITAPQIQQIDLEKFLNQRPVTRIKA